MSTSMAITVRVLGFPITIGLAFPAFLLLLGYVSRFSGAELVIWVGFGTLAIMLHELGHALAFRRYGIESSIRFWTLGGLAVPNDQEAAAELPDRQMLVVSLAGPAVGLALGGLGLALVPFVGSQGSVARFAVGMWIFVNLGWGIFNLLPIAGLDGGHVVRHLTMVALGERGRAIALGASIVSSVLVAVLAVETGFLYIAVIAILFGVANPYQYREFFEALFPGRAERRRQRRSEPDETAQWYTIRDDPAQVRMVGDERAARPRS